MAIQQSINGGLRELALFAGAGGGILGGHLLGWRTVCAVERDAYAAQVLAQRQNDGILRPFPIWSDVTTFDGRPWKGRIDVVSGGFPCQDISAAGKGAGIDGERSGLWGQMGRIIREVKPRFVFVENSPMLTSRGLGRVLADLAAMGFNAKWGMLSAANVGANHIRDRIWIYAYTDDGLSEDSFISEQMGFNGRIRCAQNASENWDVKAGYDPTTEPGISRVANDVAFGVDRGKAIGNGQVPAVAATAWRILSQ